MCAATVDPVYEVVWSGGELLPERETQYDTTWDRVPMIEDYEPERDKRRYRKVNAEHWARRSRRSRDVQSTPTHSESSATVERGGSAKQQSEYLQEDCTAQEGGVASMETTTPTTGDLR